MSLKVLFIGDVVSKLGRRGLQELVPKLREEYGLDLIIANIENLAHGKGITQKTFEEIAHLGIDVYTSGNHVFKQKEGIELMRDESIPILRPANYPKGVPGRGSLIIEKNSRRVLVINLIGRVFMHLNPDDPFVLFDDILEKNKDIDEVIVDFHAEATSEKKAFAWYALGRASLVVGTHTHIPTADQDILGEEQLGYVTDVGMVGAKESVLGVKKDEVIEGFLTQLPLKHTMMESGAIVFNSILADIQGMRCLSIKRVDKVITEIRNEPQT